MSGPWPVAGILAAARAELLRPGAVSDGFRGVRVEPGTGQRGSGELLVDFRWRLDPVVYRLAVGLPTSPPTGPWTGLPVASAREWVAEVSGQLGEELGTGLVRRAGRSGGPGVVVLDPGRRRDPAVPGYQVTDARLVGPVRASVDLLRRGVRPGRVRELLVPGRLIAWVAVHVDGAAGAPDVGRAALGWVAGPTGPAGLDLFAVDPAAPAAVAHLLAHCAVHRAAEAGATRVFTTLTHPALVDAGLRPTGDGTGSVLDTARIGLVPTSG